VDRRTELLSRVRDDAEGIALLANGGTNIPLEKYIDKTSLNALCDALALEPEGWQAEDLERILIIRDGLYVLRNKLRDLGDAAEHSVDQLLSAVDRLYADLERALREINQQALQKAQTELAALQRGTHISTGFVPATTEEMKREAGEVLVTAHISIKQIEFNLLKIDRSSVNFEVLRNMKLSVQRLSASVFAIKLSLEQSIVYQGVFKLLSDGADRIIEELKKLVAQVKTSYDTATEFIKELNTLAEKGTRFARLVAEFLNKAFARSDAKEETVVTLRVQVSHQGEAILAASALAATTEGPAKAVLAGKNGNSWTADFGSSRFSPRYRLHDGPVYSLAHLDKERIIVGTDNGVQCDDFRSPFNERVVAIAIAPWGAKGSYGRRDGAQADARKGSRRSPSNLMRRSGVELTALLFTAMK
jgi:hypothetical protein